MLPALLQQPGSVTSKSKTEAKRRQVVEM